jgi:hypothetical protein
MNFHTFCLPDPALEPRKTRPRRPKFLCNHDLAPGLYYEKRFFLMLSLLFHAAAVLLLSAAAFILVGIRLLPAPLANRALF